MSIDDKRITFAHLRAHRGHHEPSCTKRWMDQHSLDWRYFCRNGYTVGELRTASFPQSDQEVESLIAFVEKNGLWDE